jgi:hypothetical protein
MDADPLSLLVLQGMHEGAAILGVQEKFKSRMQSAMCDEEGAHKFEVLYHQIYREYGMKMRSSGPAPAIEYDESPSLNGSLSFLRNLANGVIENCIGWYSEEIVASIFGATKVKELGQGSTLDLLVPGDTSFAIEVKSCRWSNTHKRTDTNGRSHPVGRSMYYFKHKQLLEANSVNQ